MVTVDQKKTKYNQDFAWNLLAFGLTTSPNKLPCPASFYLAFIINMPGMTNKINVPQMPPV
jgi:hypothetical protein